MNFGWRLFSDISVLEINISVQLMGLGGHIMPSSTRLRDSWKSWQASAWLWSVQIRLASATTLSEAPSWWAA